MAFGDGFERGEFIGAGSVDHEVEVVAHPGGRDDLDQEIFGEVLQQSEAVFLVDVGERVVALDAADPVEQVVVAAFRRHFHSRLHSFGLLGGCRFVVNIQEK